MVMIWHEGGPCHGWNEYPEAAFNILPEGSCTLKSFGEGWTDAECEQAAVALLQEDEKLFPFPYVSPERAAYVKRQHQFVFDRLVDVRSTG